MTVQPTGKGDRFFSAEVKEKSAPTREYHWSFIDWDGEDDYGDYPTKEAALQKANDIYDDQQADVEGWRNGDTSNEEVELVRFYYNDDEEREIVEREKATVEFEYYHGDLKEHGYP
jgi:hypothetical protein